MAPKARWAAAAAVGAVVTLAGLAIVMSTATVTAAGDQVSAACASPAPTPSLPPLPTATSAPIPCSTPTPAPTARPTPNSTSSPGATPAPGSPGPGNPSGSAPGASRGPLGTPSVVPGTLVVADPLLASQLNAVLQNPVSRQHPDLLHFTPAAAAGIDPPAPTSLAWSGAAAGVVLLQPAVALAAACLLLGVAAVLLVLTRLPARTRRVAAAIPSLVALPLSVSALVLMAPAAPAAGLARAASPATYAASIGMLREHAATMRAADVAPWNQLVGIESTLSQEHSRLVFDETEIDALTNQLTAISSTAAAPQPTRPNAFAILTSDLAQTLSDHQASLAVYQQSLANEYDFFVGAVKSPQQTTQLQAVVAQKPPDVQAAVNTDISLVQTELQQEAAIASASSAPGQLTEPGLAPGATIIFHAPLSGVVTQPFGPTQFSLEPPITYKGVFYPHFHTGLDIAAPLGTPVGAAAAGKVILATSSRDSQGNLVGYGNYVVIAHGDGFLTLYGHLEKILVTAGQVVQQGQVIGLCGSTGWSTGPHVHFEIRLNGIYVDPAPYLARQLRG
jgi:murein DD-endopeptidase MepM/ murein hydrolase activator NlpD